jgi:hydrogenase-4 component B
VRLLLLAVGLVVLGGVAALATRRAARWSTRLGVGGAVAGCLAGMVPAVRTLLGAPTEPVRVPWHVPYGAFVTAIDPLSAFFLLPLLALSALGALYGADYMRAHGDGRAAGRSWFFFNLLVASMVLVVVAANAMLFLLAWEVMTLASFFLVTLQDEEASVRQAGWTYLVATHLGTACLLVLFVLLGGGGDTLDFDRFAPQASAGVLFVLALVGFGTKAGFVPFHVWLPEAHPAAPSHVSAVMSGVMIKTGIYGLLRTLTFCRPLPAWAGWLLLAVGATSGVLGVLFALAQHDLKRLLAYHSVENIGIIALGLGLGLVGLHAESPALAILGFGGGLLHVLNHALFKGLLFLGAGAVLHGAGTANIEELGGLLRRMPWTGLAFLVGAIAISGLPPLNGFVSEFLIYLGALAGATSGGGAAAVPALATIAALALVGGLASACFTKAFGVIFLGEPRSEQAAGAHEQGLAMRIPMAVLAGACILIGVCAPALVGLLAPVLEEVTGLRAPVVHETLAQVRPSLGGVTIVASALLVLVAAAAAVRRAALARRVVRPGITWDCGYALPSARMQYTGSSFAQPLMEIFAPLLGTRRRGDAPRGFFPQTASFATDTPDVFRERLYQPLFGGVRRALSALRWLQHGRVQLYVLYVAVTVVVLLVWRLAEP